ncbi:hypothetical protein G6F57_001798 [Rhizopus arrhizus]|uniref:Uncharacterized protein n=1 Tax=Rhizopus oryzae TaxID=64495 RepID=A0A9P6X506_RHIOR|nr:hypothetical protein G6F23_004005 [Rhizopus arrhizus]KAG1423896.1 hypothetical protein G6F58_002635 [Rhizopus delemar]KAG0766158.1 hypothetical protein G6F24_003835 [Rhizopus arrhizus]KAG0795392.1 hypothetical protein G6F21_002139 [Rhizopus arrhizus]KAG0800739.1 hypothetical protein G6F22_001936 [Rhizopus arrhizus]
MNVVLSALVGVGTSYFTIKNVLTAIKPWGDKMNDMCFHPANNDAQGNLRVVYSGISSLLDRQLCVFVNFFQNCLHDVLGAPVLTLLLASFGVMIAIMTIEGSRKGFKRSLLALFPVYGLLSNVIGVSVVFPLIWVPLSVFYRRHTLFKKDHWNITLPVVYGIFTAIYVGYGLPTAILLSPLVKPDTKLEQDMLAAWQFAPLLIVPLIPIFIKFFQQPSPIDRVSDETVRNRLYVVEGKDALEKSYLLLGIVNMLIYYGMYLIVAHQGIRIWDSLVLLYHAPDNLPGSVSFGDLGQILATRTIVVDYVVLSIGFVIWALFDGGIRPAATVALIMPVVGPAAAISFYAYHRESSVQNLASTNPAFEKEVNQTSSNSKK